MDNSATVAYMCLYGHGSCLLEDIFRVEIAGSGRCSDCNYCQAWRS